MGKELYVGKISASVTENDLRRLFAVAGTVTSVHLITDRETGEFKGCGYVRMSTDEEARDAIESLDGALLEESLITVVEARPQKQKGRGSGGGRGKTRPKQPGRGRRG